MKRRPTLAEALFPIIAFLVIIIIGYSVMQLALPPLIIIAAIFASIIALRVGLSWQDMMNGIRDKLNSSMEAILILMFVGILIGIWMISGTIPMMIYYGLKVVSPQFLYLSAFLVTLIVSVVTGTSWGSVGTAGLAFIGIAHGLDVSLAITAGAIVSGSYFGDKMSPLSDTTNLAAAVVGINLYEHIKHMFYTTIPAALIALVVYVIAGFFTSVDVTSNLDRADILMNELSNIFSWNILLFLPPLIVIIGAVMKQPTIPTFVASSIVAGILAAFIQGFSLNNIFDSMISGFEISMISDISNITNISDEVTEILVQGGLESMFGLIMIIFTAFAYAGIVVESGCLEVIVEKILGMVKNTGELVLATVIASISVSLIALTAYLVIIMVGETFKKVYKEKGLSLKNLSRTLEDSGTVVIPLIPWTQASLFIVGVLGVSVIDYAPWAIFCYTGFIIAIIYGYTGFGIAKEENYEAIDKQS